MRPVARMARRTQAALRRPPRSRLAVALRRAGLGVAACLLVGAGADALWRSGLIGAAAAKLKETALSATDERATAVRQVLTEGQERTDKQLLVKLLADSQGQNILAVDIDALQRRLQRVPWVREVSVSRELPDTLRVRLEEYEPVARWFDGVRQLLVSEQGAVLQVPNAQKYGQLPMLLGEGAPGRIGDLRRLLAADPELGAKVTAARLVGGRRWNVYLGRIEVRLPAEEPDRAWQRLAAQHRATGLLARSVAAVDMRHPQWLTLLPAGAATATAPST